MTKKKKILFLSPYPFNAAPSQRFRFEQYFGILRENGIEHRAISFYDNGYKKLLYGGAGFKGIMQLLLRGLMNSLKALIASFSYDYIFLHREFIPFGPPILEWIIVHILQKKIIFDFDDAIWLNDPNEFNQWKTKLKWKSKISRIIKWSHKVSCGNSFLKAFALKYNSNAVINPTTLNTNKQHNPQHFTLEKSDKVTIGWTGSHTTNYYLHNIESVLQNIEKDFPVNFIFISNKNPELNLKNATFIPWSEKTEVSDLLKADIGIMPLSEDEWSLGKCGFKLLQYMSLEIPSVASPVGENKNIITHGEDGFLAKDEKEWYEYLKILIFDKNLRHKMGEAGRQKIIQNYSTDSNSSNFLSLFNEL